MGRESLHIAFERTLGPDTVEVITAEVPLGDSFTNFQIERIMEGLADERRGEIVSVINPPGYRCLAPIACNGAGRFYLPSSFQFQRK